MRRRDCGRSSPARSRSPPSRPAPASPCATATRLVPRPAGGGAGVADKGPALTLPRAVLRSLRPGLGSDPRHAMDYEIIGIVEDAKSTDPRVPAWATEFIPLLQDQVYGEPVL